LQNKSRVLLSAIHQYLFYAYSYLIHPQCMDTLQIILEVINPLQVQSLCKDIQLALFQLFDNNNITQQLPKYIEASLRFPQYLQLSFWTLLNAFLRTRNNPDELFIKTLKHLAKLKRAYISNNSEICIWITSPAMNGLLDWTQIVHRSKRIDEIYDMLLSFPTKAHSSTPNEKFVEDEDDDDDVVVGDNKNREHKSNEVNRSTSPSTTVFNESMSSFDEFHIQALVQLLSLKSPRWKVWLQIKLKFLKNKYEQKQAEYEEKDDFTSLNKVRKRRNNDEMISCNVAIDKHDEGYLLNLLKFYEYLTFVEPNIDDNAVSNMAKSYLFDADQREILVRFFSQFSSLQYFLSELQQFWPAESSKSSSPHKKLALIGGATDSVMSIKKPLTSPKPDILPTDHYLDDAATMRNGSSSSNNNNNNIPVSQDSNSDIIKPRTRQKRKRRYVEDPDDDSDDDESYDETVDAHDRESSEESDDDMDQKQQQQTNSGDPSQAANDTNDGHRIPAKRSKTVSKTVAKKQKRSAYDAKKRMLNDNNNQSDSSTSSVSRNKNSKIPRTYQRKNDANDKASGLPQVAPIKYAQTTPVSPKNGALSSAKDASPCASLSLIPKRKQLQFSPSLGASSKRPRDGTLNKQPPTKKRKIVPSVSGNNNNVASSVPAIAPKTRPANTSLSHDIPKRHTQDSNHNNNNSNPPNSDALLKRSPRKRSRQIQDDESSEDEDKMDTKQKHKFKKINNSSSNNGSASSVAQKSPTRSESSGSFEDDDDEEEEDSLASRYTPTRKRVTNNTDVGSAESWLN